MVAVKLCNSLSLICQFPMVCHSVHCDAHVQANTYIDYVVPVLITKQYLLMPFSSSFAVQLDSVITSTTPGTDVSMHSPLGPTHTHTLTIIRCPMQRAGRQVVGTVQSGGQLEITRLVSISCATDSRSPRIWDFRPINGTPPHRVRALRCRLLLH